jgi:hypothetical protein
MLAPTFQPPPGSAPAFNGFSAFHMLDSTGLAEHVRVCTQSRGRWRQLVCATESAKRFFASRVVTSGVLVTILIAAAFAVL